MDCHTHVHKNMELIYIWIASYGQNHFLGFKSSSTLMDCGYIHIKENNAKLFCIIPRDMDCLEEIRLARFGLRHFLVFIHPDISSARGPPRFRTLHHLGIRTSSVAKHVLVAITSRHAKVAKICHRTHRLTLWKRNITESLILHVIVTFSRVS